MTKIIVASFAILASTLAQNTLPALAHEGSAQDHLLLGFGMGEVTGLFFGLLDGGATVLAINKYKKTKSGK